MKQCFFIEKVNGKVIKAKVREGNKITTLYFSMLDKKWIATPEEIEAINKFGKGE